MSFRTCLAEESQMQLRTSLWHPSVVANRLHQQVQQKARKKRWNYFRKPTLPAPNLVVYSAKRSIFNCTHTRSVTATQRQQQKENQKIKLYFRTYVFLFHTFLKHMSFRWSECVKILRRAYPVQNRRRRSVIEVNWLQNWHTVVKNPSQSKFQRICAFMKPNYSIYTMYDGKVGNGPASGRWVNGPSRTPLFNKCNSSRAYIFLFFLAVMPDAGGWQNFFIHSAHRCRSDLWGSLSTWGFISTNIWSNSRSSLTTIASGLSISSITHNASVNILQEIF